MIERQLITDTHPLIYFFCDGGRRLSKPARLVFEDALARNPTVIFVPAPALWEMSRLVEDGDLKLTKPFDQWLDDVFSYPMFNPLPFDLETVKVVHDVRFHRDPFDRAIVATALQMGLPLITNDGQMHRQKPCKLFWD